MDEKVLVDWKETHADVYSKFKQDLEEQLLKPYHQNILDMGDAEPLQPVIANLTSIASNDGFDIDRLYSKAVEKDNVSSYCLCCYLHLDNGADHLAEALEKKSNGSDAQVIIDGLWKFLKQNSKQDTAEVTTDELNLLSLRRWHYDHPEEYKEFTATFQKAYDGDTTFFQNNFFFLMEMLSFKGVKGMMRVVAGLFPGNKHYEQSLTDADDNPLKGRLSEMLDSSLNNEAIRERLLHKNPYLFSLYYWIVFDNGFLLAADLITQTFLKPESPYWEKLIGRKAVETLIGASINKAQYSKTQWKELTKQLKRHAVLVANIRQTVSQVCPYLMVLQGYLPTIVIVYTNRQFQLCHVSKQPQLGYSATKVQLFPEKTSFLTEFPSQIVPIRPLPVPSPHHHPRPAHTQNLSIHIPPNRPKPQ